MNKQTIYDHNYLDTDHEIILKLRGEVFEWVDPVREIWIDNNTLYVDNGLHTYDYSLPDIIDYNIRPYSCEDIYDYQGGNL